MNIQINRKWETKFSVCGEMVLPGLTLFTIEPARVDPVISDHPCIIAGTFAVEITYSPRLGYRTPELLNVPHRTDIRWHIANFPKDVEGCAGIGLAHSTDFIGQSRIAFNQMMAILADQDEIIVTYIEQVIPEQQNTKQDPV